MIKVKQNSLDEMFKILNDVKLNRISNTSIRKSIIKILLESKKHFEELDGSIASIREKYFSDFKSEDLDKFQEGVNKIGSFLRQNDNDSAMKEDEKLSKKYPEITQAYNKYMSDVNNLQAELVEIDIEPISLDEFMDAMVSQDIEITGKTLDLFNPILNNEN